MNTKLFACLAVLALFLITGCRTRHFSAADAPGIQDQIFILEALASGAKEIEMGKLGIQRAQDLDLRLLAQRIFDDHTRAQESLLIIAQQKGVEVPTNRIATPHIQHLSQLPQEQFDRAYLSHMLETHVNDITKYEATSRNALSTDVRNFAATTLPALREHLRIAQNINNMLLANDSMINEPAGAERATPRRDPFYQGDAARHHQFDQRTPQ